MLCKEVRMCGTLANHDGLAPCSGSMVCCQLGAVLPEVCCVVQLHHCMCGVLANPGGSGQLLRYAGFESKHVLDWPCITAHAGKM